MGNSYIQLTVYILNYFGQIMNDPISRYMRTDSDAPSFTKGQEVVYMPAHVEDPLDKDAEVGVVVDLLAGGKKYMVDYNDGAPVSKQTHERWLYAAKNVAS